MKVITETMGVFRTHPYEKLMNKQSYGKRFYSKAQDDPYLSLIREIIDNRATYGYRRVKAFLNRRPGDEKVNNK